MNFSITSLFMIICMTLVSSVDAQGSQFYTLPDADMAAREQQEGGFRSKSSKKSAINNKDWMGAPPVSRQQSKHSSNSSSLRKNKKKKKADGTTIDRVDTINMPIVKESIQNDRVSSSSRSIIAPSSSSESQETTFDFS